MKKQVNFEKIFWVAVTLLLLLLPGIYNRFPIVTSDTGTYVASGIEEWVPIDRPISYGLFIRFTSLSYNLWFPILMQCLIMALLLIKLYRLLLPGAQKGSNYIILSFLICFTTGIAWYSTQLMPDIFVGIGFLSLLILMLNKNSTLQTIGLCLLYVVSLIVHNSHQLIFTLFTFVLLVLVATNLFNLKATLSLKKAGTLFSLTLLCWLVNPSINLFYDGKFKHSGAPYAFLTAKYAENGVLAEYLKNTCIVDINKNKSSYFIRNLKSNLFLDVEGYSLQPGAKVHQWEYTGVDNQEFAIEKQSPPFVRIKSVKSGKYLTAYYYPNGQLALKQDNLLNSNSQLFEVTSIQNQPNKISIKLKDKNVFIATDTVGIGLGMQFIECNNSNLEICQFEIISAANCFCNYKDKIPKKAIGFLWDENSILSKTGNWSNHEQAYKKVMNDILFSPDYFWLNTKAAVRATAVQLTRNKLGDGVYQYDTLSSPYNAIKNNFPKHKKTFIKDRQNIGEINLSFQNFINEWLMLFSCIALFIILIVKRFRNTLNQKLVLFTFSTLMLLVINAFVTGAIANILDRLQSRISWILPLLILILITNILQHEKQKLVEVK